MPLEFADQMYCSHQILIPPTLPKILKTYAKAAIRTQPKDLLLWSLHYFKAVADGLPPPVKERIEYPPVETESGLTPGYLKVLLNQIGSVSLVSKDAIIEKWEGICLDRKYAELLFKVGNFPEQVEWVKFVALAAGTLEKNLTGTMSLLCELLTEEPEGGSAIIPVETFLSLYKFLAALDCGPKPIEESDSGEKKSSDEEIHTEVKKEEGSEIWDDLLKDVGDQKSIMTVATDDIKEIDSKHGLEVWPDIVPNELKLEESSSENIDEVASAIGIPVWNEEVLVSNIEDRILEGAEEGVAEEQVSEEKVVDEPGSQMEIEKKEEKAEIKVEVTDEESEKPESEALKTEETPVSEIDSEMVETEASKSEVPDDTSVEPEEVLPPAVTLVEPDSDIILVPSPVGSETSACTEDKSVEGLSDVERVPSAGQVLQMTTSLQDVKVQRKEADDQNIKSECAEEKHFWANIPGIGPPVPLEVVEEVEVYLRNCAAKQSDMVMPRNLRHFLCPSLDGLPSEEINLVKPECDDCVEEFKSERAKKLEVHCRKVIAC